MRVTGPRIAAALLALSAGCATALPFAVGARETADGGLSASDAAFNPDAFPPGDPDHCDGPNPGDLFVTPNGTGDCSMASPCSITTALTRGGTINLASGSYTGDFTMQTGMHLIGAWTTDWKRACTSADPVTLQAENNGAVITAANAQDVLLSHLTLVSKQAGPSESLYGVLATNGSVVTLSSVTMNIGTAGNGADGAKAGVGGSAPQTCGSGGGGPGQVGDAGAPGQLVYDALGVTAAVGKGGDPGTAGQDGTASTDLSGTTCNVGAGQTCVTGDTCTLVGTAGTNGCGSPGARGGSPGGSGGSAIGIYVSTSSGVKMVNGSITVESGGIGGNGGAPGTGLPGSVGTKGRETGGSSGCIVGALCSDLVPPCTSGNGVAAAAAGGMGGTGGTGGQGGGGAGGDAYGVVMISGGLYGAPAGSFPTINVSGGGGAGGAPNGPPGASDSIINK